ncbi:Crp/Fnr family transcriptional regulator [Dactylosporangium matsuzakiense]|uniref:Crp/Fnr family transcriptional regulator n=1 Tax=Dactylosporangium matsuzakiense TaxID=53360 RepID=A0A9W6KI67_9ACTN|nr:Crp/Fnr family transcriptional regulator [Dactylosporangium matsuzakiense]UWZ41130.1 Crp/Fnr family transcriptional regulator [Dactylosporangium matsuzakiense]GLL00964.1 Crp/Fnr family transcriptional regulator [Dactylosporangium matsuzakiense]
MPAAVLAAMPDGQFSRMAAALEPVRLDVHDLIHDSGEPIEHVYFPATAVLSMVSVVDGETAVEVATIGREGMSGLPVFLGVSASPNTVFAHVAGLAVRMRTHELRALPTGDGALHRYVQATMVQLAQNVACNRLHTTEERAARWLLTTADRTGSQRFTLTQDFLAQMLGVRRATVSHTAGALHDAGLISYTRGLVTIDDRDRLAGAACDCYRIVRAEFDRLRAGP